MKRILTITFTILIIHSPVYSARIIQISDIVNWCLDSELIIVGRVLKVEVFEKGISKTKLNNQWYGHCLLGNEKYALYVDTVLKGEIHSKHLSVSTPETCLSYSEQKSVDNNRIEAKLGYYDNSWYRLKEGDDLIIILDKKESGYEVLYRMQKSEYSYKLIADIKHEGDNYNFFKPDTGK